MVKLNIFVVPLFIAIVHAAAIGKRAPRSSGDIAARQLLGDVLDAVDGVVDDVDDIVGDVLGDVLKRAPRDSDHIVARQGLVDGLLGDVDDVLDAVGLSVDVTVDAGV